MQEDEDFEKCLDYFMGRRRKVIVSRLSTQILVGAEDEGSVSWLESDGVDSSTGGASKEVAPKNEWQQGQALRQEGFLVLKGKVVAIAAVEEIVK